MRKVIFTLATGLFLLAGVSTSTACDGHKKVQKASTVTAAPTTEKKDCTTAEKKECATTKTASLKTASASKKNCCASKTHGVEAKQETPKTGKTADEAQL